MRGQFCGISLGRCYEVFFESFAILADHVGSTVPLVLVGGIREFRLYALMRMAPYRIPYFIYLVGIDVSARL